MADSKNTNKTCDRETLRGHKWTGDRYVGGKFEKCGRPAVHSLGKYNLCQPCLEAETGRPFPPPRQTNPAPAKKKPQSTQWIAISWQGVKHCCATKAQAQRQAGPTGNVSKQKC